MAPAAVSSMSGEPSLDFQDESEIDMRTLSHAEAATVSGGTGVEDDVPRVLICDFDPRFLNALPDAWSRRIAPLAEIDQWFAQPEQSQRP